MPAVAFIPHGLPPPTRTARRPSIPEECHLKHWRRALFTFAAGLLAAATSHARPERQTPNAGLRARDTFLATLPALAEPGRPQ
ncbi:class D beta-lactamase [Burkholderia lata]|uniref:Class D beta-lactamase n=1 Tax=Burkholderia lata (strain ATCC 17760 / DSM 23089 / LMG 22485 / NCIMB 9086 / R18194 / 383) TaxID=482957 RepID=A0A6P2YHB1_BURL3|nr:hypothetical protein [Burkholderia lata]VWD21757.1 class D beta-lactamase [Burkholderia lata]